MKTILNYISLVLVSLCMINTTLLWCAKKNYTKKAPYSGFGKPSKVNRQPKIKPITGHGKRTRKGYTYVNPYSRSK